MSSLLLSDWWWTWEDGSWQILAQFTAQCHKMDLSDDCWGGRSLTSISRPPTATYSELEISPSSLRLGDSAVHEYPSKTACVSGLASVEFHSKSESFYGAETIWSESFSELLLAEKYSLCPHREFDVPVTNLCSFQTSFLETYIIYSAPVDKTLSFWSIILLKLPPVRQL